LIYRFIFHIFSTLFGTKDSFSFKYCLVEFSTENRRIYEK